MRAPNGKAPTMINRATRSTPFVLALLVATATGCMGTGAPSPELVDARAAYTRAQSGAAARVDPADLHEAETALSRAENAFRDDPSAPETRDLAVVAGLRVQIAEARAASAIAVKAKAQAQADMTALQAQQVTNAKAQTQTAQAQTQNAQMDATKTRAQLDAEREKRIELEKKLSDALTTLAKIAAIKDTDRGLVITFQGDMLFKTGESTLKAEAMLKLDKVVESLRGQERAIIVEGHTDNQGGAGSYNQTLSEKRANAVRDYLVSKGIPTDLIRAVGYGPTKGIADNGSPEGRAANRRVEIIVEPRK